MRDYADRRSDAAFAELVRRHVDLVYSAALRMVRDPHLAKDVTQGVFVALAQNSRKLLGRPVLSGWLHRTAQNLSANAVRSEVRRRAREQEAAAMKELLAAESDATWEQIAPQLDAALAELGDDDRDAVLLRYFERKSAREMAEILGTSEEAAQKRVSRAVERLRDLFARRGIAVGASGLVVVIAANAVQAAPVGLAVTISSAVGAGTFAAVTATQTALVTMNWINIKSAAAVAAAAIVAGAGTHFLQQRETNRLRAENQNLIAQQEKLTNDRDAALLAAAQDSEASRQREKDKSELLRLRNEIGLLRQQTNELAKLRAANQELRTQLASSTVRSNKAETDPEADLQKQEGIAKMNYAKNWMLAFFLYAKEHQMQFPASFEQAISHLPEEAKVEHKLGPNEYLPNTPKYGLTPDHYEIVYRGTIDGLTNPTSVIVIREKQAWPGNKGDWFRTYGFADGHSEIHSSQDGNFEPWEKQHMIPAQASVQ